jgi:hypothetical protein
MRTRILCPTCEAAYLDYHKPGTFLASDRALWWCRACYVRFGTKEFHFEAADFKGKTIGIDQRDDRGIHIRRVSVRV